MDTQILPSDEVTKVESRSYLNPQVALDESNTFIDNLRSTQDQQNEQITTDTRMLGTDVPTNLGGLTGADSYFTSRYQTPQTVANVNNLRATAQAAALNQVLENEQEIWKKKYQDAYRKYQKRQYNKANTPTTTGGGGGGDNENKGNVEKDIVKPSNNFFGVSDAKVTETDTHYIYEDPKTGKKTYVAKEYLKKIFDDNVNVTDEGAVILDTRRLLGL